MKSRLSSRLYLLTLRTSHGHGIGSWRKSQPSVLVLIRAQSSFRFPASQGRYREFKSFAVGYAKLKALLDRNFIASHLVRRMRPSDWVRWLEDNRLPCPADLKVAVAEFDKDAVDWRARAEAAEADNQKLEQRIVELERAIVDSVLNPTAATREQDTLLRLFIGMAVEQYGYDPKKTRNEAAKNISSDLALHGLSITDDTVRKYLKQASELLPHSDERAR